MFFTSWLARMDTRSKSYCETLGCTKKVETAKQSLCKLCHALKTYLPSAAPPRSSHTLLALLKHVRLLKQQEGNKN
jgi:hypothetical protein